MRALVVDDSRATRAIIRRALASSGLEVLEAANGLEGLAVLDATPGIDVALVDWNMPEMNGIEFVTAVRARPAFSDLRLVMVTTESEHDHVMQALLAGADEYVMKPFTPVALREKLELVGVRVS